MEKNRTVKALAEMINAERQAIIDERDRYRKALAWYADKDNWRSMDAHRDTGDRAREVLNHASQ